jgi:UDP-N-acetylmuramoyl-L-alanyl-D-glutamate--2,6-diaminopimelate ligase
MLEQLLRLGRKIIPKSIFKACQPIYHYLLAMLAALVYRFPSRRIYVLMITGTKGKTSTTELVSAILETAGFKTAVANTVRIKLADDSRPNRSKMTIQGRFFTQRFLHQAVKAGCTHAVLEMSSEGAAQFRHKFVAMNALIFTNLTPEHIESHGSYENYVKAKLKIAEALEKSSKPNKILIVNKDSAEADVFLKTKVAKKITYDIKQAESWMEILPGQFNIYNVLAAVTFTRTLGIEEKIIREAIANFKTVRGRMENVSTTDFDVIVDYAHTAESLQQVYETYPSRRKLCVLGGTGGSRDHWKRPVMGGIADTFCDQIFLTNEDPYDEDPMKVINEVAGGIKNKSKMKIIMDRREAIAAAIKVAKPTDVILITGKGTDPCIMGPNGTKIPWDDATVAREELAKCGK